MGQYAVLLVGVKPFVFEALLVDHALDRDEALAPVHKVLVVEVI